jgi:hypothetical protein
MAARFNLDNRCCVVHALFRYTKLVLVAGQRYSNIDDLFRLKVAL